MDGGTFAVGLAVGLVLGIAMGKRESKKKASGDHPRCTRNDHPPTD